MADKKVDRSYQGRPLTPSQRLQASLSEKGMVDVSDSRHDKGKSALVDKFREREERWRRDQAFHDRGAAQEMQEAAQTVTEEEGGTGSPADGGEGGAR